MKHSYSYQYNFNNCSKVQVTEGSFKILNWKQELRKKTFTKEQQSPEELLFPDLRMKSGIKNLRRSKFQQVLNKQTELGFEAAWFITYHYSNPYENNFNEKTICTEKKMKQDMEIMRKRFDYDCTTKNSIHMRNMLLEVLFGIKHPTIERLEYLSLTGQLPCMFFFHEMGDFKKGNLGYHTHLMIPVLRKTRSLNNAKELTRILNQRKFKKRVKTLSKKNPIVVRPVEESRGGASGLYGYLTKQTNEENTSFDGMSSLVYNPLTELVTAAKRKVSYVPTTTSSSRSW